MAAAFAVAIRTRNKYLLITALSAGITAIFGITEPAIYGVTLPRKKPFIFACVGAALGALAAAFFGTVYYSAQYLPGLIKIFQTLPDSSVVNPNPLSFIGMLAGGGLAIAVTMGLTIALDKAPVLPCLRRWASRCSACLSRGPVFSPTATMPSPMRRACNSMTTCWTSAANTA